MKQTKKSHLAEKGASRQWGIKYHPGDTGRAKTGIEAGGKGEQRGSPLSALEQKAAVLATSSPAVETPQHIWSCNDAGEGECMLVLCSSFKEAQKKRR